MTNMSKAVLVDKLQQIALCAPEIAWEAVRIFYDDPKCVNLDHMMEVMLDWVTASFFKAPDSSKETLVDTLQQLAGCGIDTAMRAVDLFADDPMYVKPSDKIEVMMDWVTAYNMSAAVNSEGTSSSRDHSEQVLFPDIPWMVQGGRAALLNV